MTSRFELPLSGQMPIDEDAKDANYDSLYQQASNTFERLLAEQERVQVQRPCSEEPTDHEAEGAMLYVMS